MVDILVRNIDQAIADRLKAKAKAAPAVKKSAARR